MKILVTGAHGLLGRSLLQQQSDAELLGCGRSSEPVAERPYYQVQLLESGAAASLLEAVRPDWVIHTAALTNVDLCETERQQGCHQNFQRLKAARAVSDPCSELMTNPPYG